MLTKMVAKMAMPVWLGYRLIIEPLNRKPTMWPYVDTCADPEGDRVSGPPPPPLKNKKNIGFLSNTGPDPWKITKLPNQHSMLSHHRWWPDFSGIWIHSLTKKKLDPSEKTFWIRACDKTQVSITISSVWSGSSLYARNNLEKRILRK